MKKIYAILICIVICICLSFVYFNNKQKPVTPTNNYGVNITSVKHVSLDTLTIFQLDSIINADTLPKYTNWTKTYLKDGETNKPYEYGVLYNKATGVIYTIKKLQNPTDTLYILQKKKTTSNKNK